MTGGEARTMASIMVGKDSTEVSAFVLIAICNCDEGEHQYNMILSDLDPDHITEVLSGSLLRRTLGGWQ
jgi:hypothetical protein